MISAKGLAAVAAAALLLSTSLVLDARNNFLDGGSEPPSLARALDRAEVDVRESVASLAAAAYLRAGPADAAKAEAEVEKAVKENLQARFNPAKDAKEGAKIAIANLTVRLTTEWMAGEDLLRDRSGSGPGRAGAIAAGEAPVFPVVSATMVLTASDGKALMNRSVEVNRRLPSPAPFLQWKADLFAAEAAGPDGDIARMVRYILATVARTRAKLGYGLGPLEGPRNILNEGDVELAINIAVLLEEALLLRNYSVSSVQAADRNYHRSADPEAHAGEAGWSPYNPTGRRPWGTAEQGNFVRRASAGGDARTLESLFRSYAGGGTLDPADIAALYISLDRMSGKEGAVVPSDSKTLLAGLGLMNPRTPSDANDTSALAFILPLRAGEPFLLSSPASYATVVAVGVEQTPRYMIAGGDIQVAGFEPPKAWTTNAIVPPGRTGGLPPPQPLANHHHSVQWDFTVGGNFTLRLSAGGMSIERAVRLDFPVTVDAVLPSQPLNSAFRFRNLNSNYGGPTITQTPESIAYEMFTEKVWERVRGQVQAVAGSLLSVAAAARGGTGPESPAAAVASIEVGLPSMLGASVNATRPRDAALWLADRLTAVGQNTTPYEVLDLHGFRVKFDYLGDDFTVTATGFGGAVTVTLSYPALHQTGGSDVAFEARGEFPGTLSISLKGNTTRAESTALIRERWSVEDRSPLPGSWSLLRLPGWSADVYIAPLNASVSHTDAARRMAAVLRGSPPHTGDAAMPSLIGALLRWGDAGGEPAVFLVSVRAGNSTAMLLDVLGVSSVLENLQGLPSLAA